MVFNATFNSISSYIVAVSFISGGNQIGPREKHRPVASHRLTLSHNVVSSRKYLKTMSGPMCNIYII